MRNIKFRVWVNNKKWSSNLLVQATEPLPNCEAMKFSQYTGILDREGNEVWEGDVRVIEGKKYKLVCDGWRFRFERNLVEFGENESIILDEDSAFVSTLIGNIYENPELTSPASRTASP